MKSQEWFDDRVTRIKALCFRMNDPKIYPELEKLLFEIKEALVSITMKGPDEVTDLIVDHLLRSRTERMAIYEQFGIKRCFVQT